MQIEEPVLVAELGRRRGVLKERRREAGVLAMAQMEVLVVSWPRAIEEMEAAKTVRELVLTEELTVAATVVVPTA